MEQTLSPHQFWTLDRQVAHDQRKKLGFAGILIAGTTAYMAYLGAAESWQYYLTAEECLAQASQFTGRSLRVSGRVASGSLDHSAASPGASFKLEAGTGQLPIVYVGPVPDNMAEQIEVVVEGRLDDQGTLRADKLLTKCASKYASDADTRSQ